MFIESDINSYVSSPIVSFYITIVALILYFVNTGYFILLFPRRSD